MDFELIEFPSFNIAGITVSTTNANGQSQQDIGGLWGRFMSNAILQRIPNKASGEICCMYTDYESDFNAPYTVVLGSIVNTLIDLPVDLTGKAIPAQRYRVYKTGRANPEAVVATWMHIWQSDASRAYVADFDVYKEDGSVETYLSVNS